MGWRVGTWRAAAGGGLLALVATGGVTPTAGQDRGGAVVQTQHFAFHSDPWINLHHFLYQWARADGGIGTGRQAVDVAERSEGRLEAGARATWEEAVAFYRAHVAERDHFDEAMLGLKVGLLELGGDATAEPPDDIAGISRALSAAMTVYRSTWWPEHDRANRRWIERVAGDVERYEQRWVETVSHLFGGAWVDGHLRVDAAAYANWAGGYTSNGPPHTVVWSRDEMNHTGLYGLELVFHESGHVSPLGGPLRRTVGRIFAEAGVDEPANLRHAMLFATAGAGVAAIAAERGRPEHVPYVVQEGLVGFAGWAPIWPAVRTHWIPIVGTGADPVPAIVEIARAVRGLLDPE